MLKADADLVSSGYEHFYNLEYDKALTLFREAAAKQPDDPDLHNHIAETLLFREMFREFAA